MDGARCPRPKGEPYVVRSDITNAKKGRAERRKSLTFFGQLTDPQIADEMSPARLELVDPISGPTSAAWRPQEALGVRVFDSTIRNMNANRVSPITDGRANETKLKFAVLTGDIADSAQKNEVQMFRETLEGGTVDPFSGKKITTEDQQKCRVLGAKITDAEKKMLNKRVAKRQYTGVQNFKDWPGQIEERYEGFWDPNLGATGNRFGYGASPQVPEPHGCGPEEAQLEGSVVPVVHHPRQPRHPRSGQRPRQPECVGAVDRQHRHGCNKPWPNTAVNPENAKGLPGGRVHVAVLSRLSSTASSTR